MCGDYCLRFNFNTGRLYDSDRVSHPCCRTKLFKRGLRDDVARPRPLNPDSQPWKISRSWTRSAHASPNSQRRTCMWTPRLDPRATFSRRVNLTTAREDTRDQIDSWNGGTHPFDGGRQRVVTLAGTVVTKIKRWPSRLTFFQCCGSVGRGLPIKGRGNLKRSLGVPA
jgi:hypothetical protein